MLNSCLWRLLRRRKAGLLAALSLLSCAAVAQPQPRAVDPDCQAVAGAAQAARERALGSIDGVATSASGAVQRSKGCVDQIIGGAVRAIPSFGGGLVDQVASRMSRDLATQACQLIASKQNQIQSQAPVFPGVLPQTVPGSAQSPPAAPAPSGGSPWDRLGRLF